MIKNKHLLPYLLVLLSLIGNHASSQAQTTEAKKFECTCAGISELTIDPVVLCEGQAVLSPNISGTASLYSFEWLKDGVVHSTEESPTVTEIGTYLLKVTDGDCVSRQSIEVKSPEDYFKDNCFIVIPIENYELTKESGIAQPNTERNHARSRMDGLTVTVREYKLDIIDMTGSTLVSDDCEKLGENISAYEMGEQVLAHVADGFLYIGSNKEGNNEFGQAIVDKYLTYWKGLTHIDEDGNEISNDILSAPISYTCAEQFPNSIAYDHWWELFKIFIDCKNDKPEKGGIVPKCLWECSNLPQPNYLPLVVGVIDGGANVVTETVDAIKGALNLGKLLADYTKCSLEGLDYDFFKPLEERENIPAGRIQEIINVLGTQDGRDCLAAYDALKDINNKIEKVKNVLLNLTLEQVTDALTKIKDSLLAYLNKISDCSDLKKCNVAMYEQGKLLITFAGFFIQPETAIPYISTLLGKAGRYLDDLMEFIRDMNKSPDLLGHNTKKLIAEDRDLTVAWNKLRNLGCPLAFDDRDGSSRNKTGKEECEKLLKTIFTPPFTPEQRKKIRNLVKDTETDPAFFNILTADDNKLLDNWVLLSDLSDLKQWVRKSVDLLNRMNTRKINGKTLTKTQKEYLAKYYKGVTVPPACNPLIPNTKVPCGFTLPNGQVIQYDKYGFPELTNHVSDKNHIFSFDNLNGRDSDFTKGKNALQEYLDANGGGRVIKLNNSNSWSSFKIKQNGIETGPYTWHHVEDGKTLEPVLKTVHDALKGRHGGGGSLARKWPSLKGFFDN